MPTIARKTNAVTGSDRIALGGAYLVTGTYTGPASYVTGGEALVAGDFGLGLGSLQIRDLMLQGTGAEVLVWDDTAKKVKILTADGVEAGNGTNQSAVVSRFWALVV